MKRKFNDPKGSSKTPGDFDYPIPTLKRLYKSAKVPLLQLYAHVHHRVFKLANQRDPRDPHFENQVRSVLSQKIGKKEAMPSFFIF